MDDDYVKLLMQFGEIKGRVDVHDADIIKLRERSHKNGNDIHKHEAQIAGMKDDLAAIRVIIEGTINKITRYKWVIIGLLLIPVVLSIANIYYASKLMRFIIYE